MQKNDICVNCGRACDGPEQKFCPACGQATPANKIDWKFLGREFENNVLQMERGVLYSAKSLLLRPGHLIREYLQGQRVRHVRPFFLMLLLTSLLVVLDKYLLGNSSLLAAPDFSVASNDADKAEVLAAFQQDFQKWLSQNMSLINLLMVPVKAAIFRLAFRSYRDVNYPEWVVITAFLLAQQMLLMMLFLPMKAWLPDTIVWAGFAAVLVNMLSLVQLFSNRSRWSVIWRSLLGFFLYLLATSAVAFLIGMWMGYRAAIGA